MNESYFSRCATWDQMGDQLVVHDSFSPKAPRMITMEPWHQVAFSAADGEHTVEEFIAEMASQYENGAPPGLAQQIQRIISELLNEGIIRLHPTSEQLPPYFKEEYLSQPPEVRKKQMQDDGRSPECVQRSSDGDGE